MTIRSNKKFVAEQLALAGYVGTDEGFLISSVITALDKSDIDDSLIGEVESLLLQALDLFNGHRIAEDDPTQSDTSWTDAKLGDISIRDRVRVKLDAYESDNGILHNGRQGKIIGFHGYRVSVLYDGDDTPRLHFVSVLEKLL